MNIYVYNNRASLVAQNLTSFPSMQETCIWPLGREDPLEKGMAAHSSILVWRTPWTEEPGGQQSMELQRVRHDWVTNPSWVYICVYIYTYIHVHGFTKYSGMFSNTDVWGLSGIWALCCNTYYCSIQLHVKIQVMAKSHITNKSSGW